jgi:hypothetical protein
MARARNFALVQSALVQSMPYQAAIHRVPTLLVVSSRDKV